MHTEFYYSVHIIAQSANRYIVAFHIAILYDIYLCHNGRQSVYIAANGPAVAIKMRSLSLL